MNQTIQLDNFLSFFEVFAGLNFAVGLFDFTKMYIEISINQFPKILVESFRVAKNGDFRIKLKSYILYIIFQFAIFIFEPISNENKTKRLYFQFGIFTSILIFIINYTTNNPIGLHSLSLLCSFSICSILNIFTHQYNVPNLNQSNLLVSSYLLIPSSFFVSWFFLNLPSYISNKTILVIIFLFLVFIITSYFSDIERKRKKLILFFNFFFSTLTPLVFRSFFTQDLVNTNHDLIIILLVLSITIPSVYLIFIIPILNIVIRFSKKISDSN